MEIRAIVSPVPYAETARKVYADGKAGAPPCRTGLVRRILNAPA